MDTSLNVPEVIWGEGRHAYYLSADARREALKFNYLTIPFIIMSLCFSKISICLFLLRIIGGSNAPKKKVFLKAMILLLLSINTLDFITVMIQCRPLRKLWDNQVSGTCWAPEVQAGFAYVQGGMYIYYVYWFVTLI